jgi:UV excision repair protein RAD23
MNGIPPGVAEAAAAPAAGGGGGSSSSGGGSSSAGGPLQSLRNHPQFDALRRLVQSNPQTLQAVLTQIGQQDPQLLQEINENQAVFLEMMNEPVAEGGSAGSSGGSSAGTDAGAAGAGGMEAMLGGMSNPAQMAQMLQAMGPEERAQMAAMMGLTSEQLDATAQAIASMPPEQFQQYMQMAMAGGGGGMGGMMGGGGGGGGGGMAIQLTQEEMAAVDRLASMGFDRAEAAQAYLACDKNEELAANLLMDGGFGFGDDGGAGGAPGGNGGGGDGDDMYD